MPLNERWTRCSRVELFLLLCALVTGACSGNDQNRELVRHTISELRASADSFDHFADFDGCAQKYLAPAFRAAIPRLEKDGLNSLPLMLAAVLPHGFDVLANVSGWAYGFFWLETGGQVRGFYLRSDGEPDVDLYPSLPKDPHAERTALMFTAGPILRNEEEMSKVPDWLKGSSIIVNPRILSKKKVFVGVILANGQKASPIEALFREGDERLFNGRSAASPSSAEE